ncbi:hypothetical protein [Streptomyces sp. NPDC050164]|uniref:hypothetical protein n=1 Tax=Streptomyces sp. NPDC050164 TaxID=3365605 RepID=UPI0037A95779
MPAAPAVPVPGHVGDELGADLGVSDPAVVSHAVVANGAVVAAYATRTGIWPHRAGRRRGGRRFAQRGATADYTDTYHGHFARLVPDEQVVEVLAFEAVDPALGGTMPLTTTLADAEGTWHRRPRGPRGHP